MNIYKGTYLSTDFDSWFDSSESTNDVESVAHQHMLRFCDENSFFKHEQEDVSNETNLIPNYFIPITFMFNDF